MNQTEGKEFQALQRCRVENLRLREELALVSEQRDMIAARLEDEGWVSWQVDDTLVKEVRHVAAQLGITFEQAIGFLVGAGLALAQERGLVGDRAVELPGNLAELLRLLNSTLPDVN